MKKTILWSIGAVVVIFLGWRAYISSHGEAYFREYLDGAKRVQQNVVRLELKKYLNGFSSAEALVEAHFTGGDVSPLRNPLPIESRIDYGPFFFSELRPGLLRITTHKRLAELLTKEGAEELRRSLERPVTIDYRGIMDWMHVVHEELSLSAVEVKEGNVSIATVAPIRIVGAYELSNLKGRWSLTTPRIDFRNPKTQERLQVKGLSAGAAIAEIGKEGPIFGRYNLNAQRVRTVFVNAGKREQLDFGGSMHIGLEKRTPDLATLTLGIALHSENNATRTLWKGIHSASLDLTLKNLGIEGLRRLSALEKERQAIQERLATAVGGNDDLAMQKAILALQALDKRWIDIYNALLIPGKTALHLDETIDASQRSRLVLDLRYTGQPLQGDPMTAMISLMAHADRLAEGRFDLTLEKSLAKRLYPNGIFVLDSMVSKNLATFKGGLYHLQGEIKAGKIIINGTKYAPQELMMLILM